MVKFMMGAARKRARPKPPETTSLGSNSGSTLSLAATLPQTQSELDRRGDTQRGPSQDPLAPANMSGSTKKSSTAPNVSWQSSNTSGSVPTVKQVRKTQSWYGSWPRVPTPSSASTQVAKETIMGGSLKGGSAPDFSRFELKKSADGSPESDTQSTRTLAKIPESGSKETQEGRGSRRSSAQNVGAANTTTSDSQGTAVTRTRASSEGPVIPEIPQRASTHAVTGWLGLPGFLGWSTAPDEGTEPSGEDGRQEVDRPEDAESAPEHAAEPSRTSEAVTEPPKSPTKLAQSTGSWFGPWFGNAESSRQDTPKATNGETVTETMVDRENDDTTTPDAPSQSAATASVASKSQDVSRPSAGSTWAFWSRDTGSGPTGKSATTQEEGELAVIGDGSETSPRRSSGMSMTDQPAPANEAALKNDGKGSKGRSGSLKSNKRARPKSVDIDESVPATTWAKSAGQKAEMAASKTAAPNLLLPSFRSTYRMKQNPSIISQIKQMLLRTEEASPNHVFLIKEPPRIRKAIAIGVHGLFPHQMLRPLIGQPTGTSLRFATHCADAIRRWADSHGCQDCEIEKIALEGEGKIGERVDNLWKLLLNWIEHIRRADLILVACHSQGVPVGIMLAARLCDLGIISAARIGICGMAGVNLGPFVEYRSSMGMLMGAGSELWQFADAESELSKRLERAMKVNLEHGTRISLIGSMDDQLVPMESAVYSAASHPYIYRAVFIDGRVHAGDFIAHLVAFALKLRNLGGSDHGLIRELSAALAGSLYSGEGHSRLYHEQQIYDLAVSHTLESTTVRNAACHMQREGGLANSNPYVLPWIVRGMLEESLVKTELSAEAAELLMQFDKWQPTTKALKDVKYRLEAVRSRL